MPDATSAGHRDAEPGADRPRIPLRSTTGPARRRWRAPGHEALALWAVLGASVVFVAVRLGPALIGLKTFSGVDIVAAAAPWNDHWLRTRPHNPFVGDTIDYFLPGYVEMNRRLWSGDIPLWSSLGGSGIGLLSSPNLPTLTPSGAWMALAPTWWAVGVAKLIQLLAAFGGMMLWLRRLGTSWAAGAVAGLLYCGSGFFVAWSGWPAQASVAATIPMLFWAIERFLALRTGRSALLISLAVAWLLLGGFPAVAGHALFAGAVYFLVRCLAAARQRGPRGTALTVAGGTAAVLLGIGLSAIQFLPMLFTLSDTDIAYRSDRFDQQQPVESFLSVFFPRAFNPTETLPQAYQSSNPIAAYAYLGMGAVGLAVLAILAGRSVGIARGAVPALAVIGALAAALVWRHGFWTDWLQDVPVFSQNSSGRLREPTSLAGCALAGIGFNVLFVKDLPDKVRTRLVTGAWVLFAAAVVATIAVGVGYGSVVDSGIFRGDAALELSCLLLIALAFTAASARTRVTAVDPEILEPTATAHRSRAGSRRSVMLRWTLVGLAAVIGAQMVSSTGYFWPMSAADEFYPTTPGIAAAQAATGQGRALLGGTFPGTTGAAQGIRTVTAHTFQPESWKEYIRSLDPEAYTGPARSQTNPRVSFKLDDLSPVNPLLDRMAVTSVLTSPAYIVPGPQLTLTGDPTTTDVTGGAPATVGTTEVTAGSLTPQNLRGFMVQVAAPAGDGIHGIALNAVVRDAAGQELARGTVIRPQWERGWVQILVAGEDLGSRPGPLTVGVSVLARDVPDPTLRVTTIHGRVRTIVVASAPDGLRETYADGAVTIWQRPSALPRIRWASSSLVLPDPKARLAALADPATPDSTVVLDDPGPPPAGRPAALRTLTDSGDLSPSSYGPTATAIWCWATRSKPAGPSRSTGGTPQSSTPTTRSAGSSCQPERTSSSSVSWGKACAPAP